MKCNALGVFALGATFGMAAAVAAAAADPAMRRRMCCKATKAGHKAVRAVEGWMK